MRTVLLFAGFTVREAARKRLLLAVAVLSLLFVGFYLLGAGLLDRRLAERALALGSARGGGSEPAFASLALLGMYVVNFLGGLLGALVAVGSVSGEIESGTLQAIVPKPVRRSQIVLGRWLGFAALAVGHLVLLSAAVLFGTAAITGYAPPDPLPAVGLLALNALLLLTLAVLGSTLLSTLANGIVVFLLYGLAWVGGLVGSIGRATDTPLMVSLSRASEVVLPSDALWKGASYFLQPELLLAVGRSSPGGGNPFAGLEPPPAGLLVWAGAYLLLCLGAAVLVFERRDL